jgi:hypothetical protein
VQVECWGGGGAGGSASKTATTCGGGGGGGGAYVKANTVAVTAGNTYTVTVGAGGISSLSAAVSGNDTLFAGDSSTITAKGGGGASPTTDAAGAKGLHVAGSTVGNLNNEGGDGAAGTTGANGYGGGGGGGAGNQSPNTSGVGGNATASLGGAGGAGNMPGGSGAGPQSSNNVKGNDGLTPGGGGGGGKAQSTPGSTLGGTGGSGQVVLTYNGNTPITLSDNLSGLSPNTQYFWEAFAANSAGTTFSSERNFYTLANVPTAPTVNGATTTSLNVNLLGSANGNPATTQFAIQESNTTTTATSYVQADGSLAGTAVWQTTNTWGTITVTGLTPGTTYTSQVKARNNDSPQVETAFGPAKTNATVPLPPTATSDSPVCAGSTLHLFATTVTGATNYTWYGPNNYSNSPDQNPIIANVTTLAAGTYYVTAKREGQTSTSNSVVVVINPLPTITLGTSPSVTYGSTSASLPYTAASDADQYIITYDSAAHTAGFADTTFASLPAAPNSLSLVVPPTAPVATYNGTITVKNSTTTCTSANTPFTVTVTKATLTYTANTAGMNYGGTVPSLSGTVTGFVNSENEGTATSGTLAFSTSVTASSPGGTYAITGGGLTAVNYVFVQAAGNSTAFRVNPAPGAFDITTTKNKAATFAASKIIYFANDGGTAMSVSAVATPSAQGGTVALSGGNITYTPATDNTNADSFTYTLTDTAGGSSQGTVTVTINDANVGPSLSINTTNFPGYATVTASGITNQLYDVEISGNGGTSWSQYIFETVSQTATAADNGFIIYTDPDPVLNNPSRMYRLKQP